MKVIDFEEIKKLNISPEECYKLVSDMIKNKDSAILPAKISMKPRDGVFCNVMPTIITQENGKKIGGVKIVTRYPERKPSLDSKIMLYDFDDGELLAMLDGDFITAIRTGAVAVHSIDQFAKKDFKTIGLMGLGNVARATFLVLKAVYPDRPLRVKLLKYKGQEKDFIQRFNDCKNVDFECVDTVEELVRGSDIAMSAVTYLDEDICGDDCFDEGVLVIPIHTRGFTNCDLFFDKVYADDTGHVHHFKNFDKFKYYAEVSDVVNGRARGRENNKERILAYNIGVAMHDMQLAYHIYNILKDAELPNIDMRNSTEKFWI